MKKFVRESLQSVPAPHDLKDEIRSLISREARETAQIVPRTTIFRKRSWKVVTGVGSISAVALLLIFFAPSPPRHSHLHTQPDDANIIHQTYNNFDGVIKGTIVPAVASDDPVIVTSYFAPNVRFAVALPHSKHCKLLGGACSKYHDESIAHVLTMYDKNLVYLYETEFRNGSELQLPPAALLQMHQSGWYTESHLPDCTLVAWMVDSTLCCAVSDVTKDKLLAYLKERE